MPKQESEKELNGIIKDLREELSEVTQMRNNLAVKYQRVVRLLKSLNAQLRIDSFEAEARSLRAVERYKAIHKFMEELNNA